MAFNSASSSSSSSRSEGGVGVHNIQDMEHMRVQSAVNGPMLRTNAVFGCIEFIAAVTPIVECSSEKLVPNTDGGSCFQIFLMRRGPRDLVKKQKKS